VSSRRAFVACLLALTAAATLVAPAVRAQSPTPLPSEVPPPTPVPGGTTPSPFPSVLITPSPDVTPPPVRAAAALVEDLDTGQMLYAMNPRAHRPIASLTKIMTALLVLERTDPGDVVTASPTAAAAGGAEFGLVPGERHSVRQLLYALLLQSANDVAVALAEHVSGNVEAFVALMNSRARQLELADTRFASPNGLDDTGYSSAADLAALARAAMEQERFAAVVAARARDIPVEGDGSRHVQNRNALLWLYPGTVGVKTGYTAAAGFCLVAAAERDGERILTVVLGEPEAAWDDGAALLDHTFLAFDRVELVEAGDRFHDVHVRGEVYRAVAGASLVRMVPVPAGPVTREVRLSGVLRPPLDPGDRLGRVVVMAGDMPMGSVPLVVGPPPPAPPPAPPPGPRDLAGIADRLASALVRLVRALFEGDWGG